MMSYPKAQLLFKRLSLSLLTAVFLVSCANRSEDESDVQAVASVNGVEITVHQLNNEISHLMDEDGGAQTQVEEEVLDRLVERKLLVQRARALDLERTPQVTLDVARARERILARTYVEQLMATVGEPNELDARDYFDANPLLFSDRKQYRFIQLVVDLADPHATVDSPALNQQLEAAKNLDETIDWLKTRAMPFYVANTTNLAEELQRPVLEMLGDMAPGELARMDSEDAVIIFQLLGTETRSLSALEALPLIRNELLDTRRMAVAERELDSLRERAEIRKFAAESAEQE